MRHGLLLCCVLFVSRIAQGLVVSIATGDIKAPNSDGSFGEASIGDKALIFLCIVNASVYEEFHANPRGLYEAWQAGSFDLFEESFYGNTSKDGEQLVNFDIDESDVIYAIAIAAYDSDEYNRSYYVARALREDYSGNDPLFDIVSFSRVIADAGRWEVIYNEPPSITCTDLCVTGGVVSATYSISEFSRLNEIVSGEATSVIVAADLARTTQTNLAASITATNSGESTFTFSFNPAEQNWTNSTLFIFGVEPPR